MLSKGTTARLEVDINSEMVKQFIAVCGDDAPLHTNPAYARDQGFGTVLVHGFLIGSLISRFVGTVFPGPQSLLQRCDLAFRRPCYAPCGLTIEGKVRQVSDAMRSVVLDIRVFNDNGVELVSGKTYHSILEETKAA